MPDASSPHSRAEREDELREEFWAVAGDDLGSVATTNVARALTGLVRLLSGTEEQLQTERQARAEAEGRMRGYMRIDEERSAQKKYLMEQLEAALRAVDAARVILTLADEERDELAGEVSKYLGPWADLVEAVHAVSNPALRPS